MLQTDGKFCDGGTAKGAVPSAGGTLQRPVSGLQVVPHHQKKAALPHQCAYSVKYALGEIITVPVVE